MRGVSTFTRKLIEMANSILAADHPQTLRQLHYQLFSLGLYGYKNDKSSYRGLCRILTNARRLYRQWELWQKADVTALTERDRTWGKELCLTTDELIEAKKAAALQKLNRKAFDLVLNGRKTLDEVLGSLDCSEDPPALSVRSDWIVDELRRGEQVNVWRDAEGYIETVRSAYRRDSWQDQPNYVELWGEKATVLGALRPIAEAYGLMLRVCRGFGSAGMEDQVGRLFEGIDKPITVFYVGDHDASGVLIERDMHRRVQQASGVEFEMVRLAIHADDIRKFKLPPQTIKERDVRAAAFRKEFGKNANTVELEALPVAELKRRIAKAVRGLIDWELWKRQLLIQDVELNCIAEFADKMKNLPQAPEASE